MSTISQLEALVAKLRKELVEAEKKLIIHRGRTILLCSDPRYSHLHDDVTVDIAAEGTIHIGDPHVLMFLYDNLVPSHCMSLKTPREIEILTDDEEDDEMFADVTGEVLPVTFDRVVYDFDLPPGLVAGKSYRFFVLYPK